MTTASSTSISSDLLPEGTVIDGRYRVTRTIGAGGFARVYEARHLVTGVDVALKVLDPKANDTDGTFAERFLREARIAASLHHPNVVRVFDVGRTEGGQPYIAMELLRGHDLGREIALQGPLPPDRVFKLFLPVLEALAQGHRQGIVHKDLKPANLFLNHPGSADEALVILDYGVARVDAGEVAQLTGTGQLLGTPRYLAPEYIKEQRVSAAIDVYQIALIISEAVAGHPAVEGNAYSSMMRHCQGQLSLAPVLLQGDVGLIFSRATALDPDARFADCGAFGRALQEVELEFRALPRQVPSLGRDPYDGEAPATIVTGQGEAPGPVTDSMPMRHGSADRTLLTPSGAHSAPHSAPYHRPSSTPHGIPTANLPPFMLPPPVQPRSRVGLVVVLGVLVLLSTLVLIGFFVLRSPGGTENGAEAAESPTETASAATAAAGSTTNAVAAQKVVVFVSSEPGPATCLIDGEPRGQTPAMLELDAGSYYTLTVELEGYEPFTAPIDATRPGDQKFVAQLEPLPEKLEPVADSEEGATTTDSGKPTTATGATPNPVNRPTSTTGPTRRKDKKKKDGGGFLVAP